MHLGNYTFNFQSHDTQHIECSVMYISTGCNFSLVISFSQHPWYCPNLPYEAMTIIISFRGTHYLNSIHEPVMRSHLSYQAIFSSQLELTDKTGLIVF